MSLGEVISIALAGLGAGTINTVVGSGTLITFPVLLAFGYAPVTANVSNTIGLVPGSVSGAIGYRRELAGQRDRVLRFGVMSVAGGVDRRAVSSDSIIQALAAEDATTIEEPVARAFRALADALGSDRQALIAHASAIHRGGIELQRVSAPTLLLAGDRDPLAIRPEVLVQALSDARLQLLSGDHMEAVADPRFAAAIVEFLA